MLAARTSGLKRSSIARTRFEYSPYTPCRVGKKTASFGARRLASRIDMPERTPNARTS